MSDVSKTSELIGRLRSMATDIDELLDDPESLLDIDDVAVIINEAADALEAATRQPSENDREALAKQLRDIGAVRKVDQDCSCQDCEGAAEWVNAPLSVVLDHFKTNVSDAEPTHLVCAWCPQPARGDAWHNDGKLHPSCGQIDHGQGWVPPYTPRAAVPDAATEQLRAERDAALAAIERVREIHRNAGPSQGYDSRFKGGYGMLGDCCGECGSHGEHGVEWPCPTIAALDGAPEPEWEWAVSDQQFDFSPVRWLPLSGRSEAYVRELAGSHGRQVARRRKAGPWLPVEGEKP